MSNTLEQARNGSQKIDESLKQKLLSLNYNKNKYILLGNGKAKNRMRKELMKQPMKMGKEILGNSVMEKYLGNTGKRMQRKHYNKRKNEKTNFQM